MSEDESIARREVAQAYREVCALRLNELASGNVSRRFGDGMLISPTGATGETITEESVVFVSAAGEWNPAQRPSTEWQMHWGVYRDVPETGAVVHTHSDYCVAVASHNQALPGFHYLIGVFGGDDVPCVPYSTFGGKQLADDVAVALRARAACLLGNHGMISRGATLPAAIQYAHRLEIMCRQYVLARTLGEPSRLTASDWDEFFAKIRKQRYST